MVQAESDEIYMKRALELADRASKRFDEVPVGAVLVRNNEVVAESANKKEQETLATRHAEIICVEQASKTLGKWRLDDCTLYVTLEPCVMCAGALIQARVKTVVFGAHDPKGGACESLFQITSDARLNHKVATKSGVMKEQCSKILTDFFKSKRKQKESL